MWKLKHIKGRPTRLPLIRGRVCNSWLAACWAGGPSSGHPNGFSHQRYGFSRIYFCIGNSVVLPRTPFARTYHYRNLPNVHCSTPGEFSKIRMRSQKQPNIYTWPTKTNSSTDKQTNNFIEIFRVSAVPGLNYLWSTIFTFANIWKSQNFSY